MTSFSSDIQLPFPNSNDLNSRDCTIYRKGSDSQGNVVPGHLDNQCQFAFLFNFLFSRIMVTSVTIAEIST